MNRDDLIFGGVAALALFAVINKPIAATPGSNDKGNGSPGSNGGGANPPIDLHYGLPSADPLRDPSHPPDTTQRWLWSGSRWELAAPDPLHNPAHPPDTSGHWIWNGAQWVSAINPADSSIVPQPVGNCIPAPTQPTYATGTDIMTYSPIFWVRRGVPVPAGVDQNAAYYTYQTDGAGHWNGQYNYGFGLPHGPGGVPYCYPPDWIYA